MQDYTNLIDTNQKEEMRRLLLIGRSECGKTTLKQVLRGEKITYVKTQYVSQYDMLIDMPGEYAENLDLAHAIDVYTSEADIVGLVLSATEPYSLYPPNVAPYAHRDIIGIVTKIDHWAADPAMAEEWLRITGCERVFHVSAYTGEGVNELVEYLKIMHEKKTIGQIMDEVSKEDFGRLSTLPKHYML